jgi:hypothetical protein
MAREVYVATVNVVLPTVDPITGQTMDSANIVDYMSHLFSDTLEFEGKIIDWGYLKLGEQYCYPSKQVRN